MKTNWRNVSEDRPQVREDELRVLLGKWDRKFAPVQVVYVQVHPFNKALPLVWRCALVSPGSRIDELVDAPTWWTEIPE